MYNIEVRREEYFEKTHLARNMMAVGLFEPSNKGEYFKNPYGV